jgi:hypothetical protein
VEATSSEVLGTLYRTAGTGGGRFGFRLRTLRRVVVALFLVWASMIGGVAPHIVSATRMAIRILRENIYPFFYPFFKYELSANANEAAPNGENGAIAGVAVDQLIAWNIPGVKVFSRRYRRPTASGE